MDVDLDEKRLPAPDGIVLEAMIASGEVVTIGAVRVRGNTKTKSLTSSASVSSSGRATVTA